MLSGPDLRGLESGVEGLGVYGLGVWGNGGDGGMAIWGLKVKSSGLGLARFLFLWELYSPNPKRG